MYLCVKFHMPWLQHFHKKSNVECILNGCQNIVPTIPPQVFSEFFPSTADDRFVIENISMTS